jgi:hypothetical protein
MAAVFNERLCDKNYFQKVPNIFKNFRWDRRLTGDPHFLPDFDYQLPLGDQAKYACFKGAENHSMSSIDSIFRLKPPLFWQFLISSTEEKLVWHHCSM